MVIYTCSDAPASTREAQKWADTFKEAFKQTLERSKDPASEILKQLRNQNEYYRVLQQLTKILLNTLNEPYQSYLVKSNILLAEGMVKEAADRENPDTKHTLEAYMEIRRTTIGIRPIFDIGRWIYGLAIDHETLTHPDIVKLEEKMTDLVFLANDIYSYKKEYLACGAHHNFVTFALRDPITGLDGKDRQGAIDYTVKKFREVLEDMEHGRKALPKFGESEDVKVALYVDMMLDVVVGNVQWSLAAPRYGHFKLSGTAEVPDWGDVIFDMDPL
ncbi:hypothetical protein C0992_001482 [Termitomyces sp. T32_za158]|nr:hypothetical protein C0992_001482 [Termitomyces sp. T32_za158]